MTERSYFQGGVATGDAQQAPYSADTFTRLIGSVYTSGGGYIIPGYRQNLAFGNLTGAAVVDGILYDADTGAIHTPSSIYNASDYYRLDRYVLRVDRTTHTAKIIHKIGDPSPTPEPPALMSDDYVYEIPLYKLYIQPNSNSNLANGIIDEREFLNTAYHRETFATKNLLLNPFIFVSGNDVPYWVNIASVAYYNSLLTPYIPNGRALRVTANVIGEGLTQKVRIQSQYTFKCLVLVERGQLSINVGGNISVVLPNASPQWVMIRDSEAVATDITVTLSGITGDDIFNVACLSLTQGYMSCPIESEHGMLLFDESESFVNGDGLIGPSSDVELALTSIVPEGTKGILAVMRVTDTGSAAAANVFAAATDRYGSNSIFRIDIGRHTNGSPITLSGWIPIRPDDTGNDDTYEVRFLASEVTDMDTRVYMAGIDI